MGNITQCPNCSTHFRVVADQLKLSDGWVRCGQCGEEFDARAGMVDLSSLVGNEPPDANVPASSEASSSEAVSPEAAVDILLEVEAPFSGGAPPLSEALEPVYTSPLAHGDDALIEAIQHPADLTMAGVDLVLPAEEVAHEAVLSSPDTFTENGPTDHSAAPAHADPASESPVAAAAQLEANESVVPDVSFVRQARRQAFWHQPGVRWVLVLAGLLLAALLAAQVLVHQRDRLAAAHPSMAPWLEALCAPLGCELNAWQAIESVVIDSSALVRLRDNAYRFEVSLRNTSDLVLAAPALELTLTNARDEVVVRRVILASEWSNPVSQLPAQATQTLTVQLAMTQPEDLRMSGYRALVFYP